MKSQGERDRQDRIDKSDPPELDGVNMDDYDEILEADTSLPHEEDLSQSAKEPVFSSGLARLYGLMQKGCVGFISAFREYRSLDENKDLNNELEQTIRNADFGFIPVMGEWKEKGRPIQVDHTFAISRPQLTKEELIANLVELGRANPKYDQRSYMAVSEGVAYFISGPAGDSPEGSITGSSDKFTVMTLEKWNKLLLADDKDIGRSTLVRGPKNRSFTFSCGSFYDGFTMEPTFVKPSKLSYLRNAVVRVAKLLDDLPKRRPTIRQRYMWTSPDKVDRKLRP